MLALTGSFGVSLVCVVFVEFSSSDVDL